MNEKGNFYIFDAILAIALLLIVVLVVNSVISIPSPNYSQNIRDFNTAQDIMETLSGKVNSTDGTFLADISLILSDCENSKESIEAASKISKNKFKSLNLKNYRFSENNVLGGKVLASSGDYYGADNVSVASRGYGDYYYTLSVWQ